VLGAIVCALLLIVGVTQAKSTVYTITNRRVAMRIGAALTMTLNLPFRKIRNANLGVRKDGTGTIALEMTREEGASPVLRDDLAPCAAVADEAPEPALRCIPDAAKVAKLFADAAETAVSQPVIEAVTDNGRTARPVAAE
jgi:hypothetical protein